MRPHCPAGVYDDTNIPFPFPTWQFIARNYSTFPGGPQSNIWQIFNPLPTLSTPPPGYYIILYILCIYKYAYVGGGGVINGGQSISPEKGIAELAIVRISLLQACRLYKECTAFITDCHFSLSELNLMPFVIDKLNTDRKREV